MALSSTDFRHVQYQAMQARTQRPEPQPPKIETIDGFLYVDGERWEASGDCKAGDYLDVGTNDYHLIVVLGLDDLKWYVHATTALPRKRDRTARRL